MIYPIMHGDHVAFYYNEKPKRGWAIDPKLAVLTDGSQPKVGTAMLCGFCGQHLAPADIAPAGGFSC